MWQSFTSDKALFRTVMAVDIVTAIGILAFGLMLFITNVIYPFGTGSEEEAMRRFSVRMASDTVCSLTVSVFLIGQIVCAILAAFRRFRFTVGVALIYYVSQLFVIIACLMPFILLNSEALVDYMLPVYTVVGSFTLVTVVMCAISTVLHRASAVKERKETT